jgi:hypothetical protein
MPQYYEYGAQPRVYTAARRAVPYISRGAEARSLGSLGGYGSLGKLNVYGYAGGQDLGYVSNFGGQNKGLGAAMLSNNEKTLAAVAVIGVVGWLVFGKRIKKGFKSNPPRSKPRTQSLKEFRSDARYVFSDLTLRNKLHSFKSKPKTEDNKARRAIVVRELLSRGITR